MVVTLYGGAGTPAFAVDKRADGTVEVQINEFRDPKELQAKLAAAGVNAAVDYLPAGQTCKQPRGKPAAGSGGMLVGIGNDGKGIAFQISEGQTTAGRTLVLTVSFDQAHPDRAPQATSLSVVEGEVAPCEAVPMPIPSPSGPAPTGPENTTSGGDDGSGLTTHKG